MLFIRRSLYSLAVAAACLAVQSLSLRSGAEPRATSTPIGPGTPPPKVVKSEEEWKKVLTPQEYRVLRQAGTEPPFSGKYDKFSQPGSYQCAACSAELFTSDKKFDSHCGWPAFWAAAAGDRVILRSDSSHGMQRTEVLCSHCHSHLGHIFDDGPAPTGQRYCINSVCLKFVPRKK